ncbi:SCO family protein [Paludisphaera rhizosphaerae]|uniref:SCO family protein n=1 Tax=Paludisphaera rhizosphaerae TaxID=2711216 RepID=UPI0013EA702F|nr:SCO family protein [Paludisphaera rhizosphaerae]
MAGWLWNLLTTLGDDPSPDPLPRPPRRCDRFADVPLVDQFGRRLRFREAFVDGRALIVNTMYTVCRGTCPGTSQTLKGLREKLSPVFGDRLTIVSLSIDPERDDPRSLRMFASIYGADRHQSGLCDWRFVTGEPADVDRLRRSLDFYDLDPAVDADPTRHASTLLFGNSTSDRWAAMPAEQREPLLIEAIRRVAGFTFEQKYGIPG